MGWLSKLGKIALTAAPYVAAPFTGGLSLLGTGAANKAVQKWSESDAKKNLAKGLAPSKFDSVLGKVGTGASMASMFIPGGQLGMLGKAGNAGKLVAGGGGDKVNALAGLFSNIGTTALDRIGSNEEQQSAGLGPSIPPPPMPFGNFNSSMGQRRRLGFGNV